MFGPATHVNSFEKIVKTVKFKEVLTLSIDNKFEIM